MSVLLPLLYLPPISWFVEFLKEDSEIILEQFESFPKQTYRNRCTVYGANGRLLLIIPIQHNGIRVYNELQVSNRENWQKIHWKSIKNAYQCSAYFEYYEDQLEKIYTSDLKNLFDFNRNALEIILKILKTDKQFTLSTEYFKNPEAKDLRMSFSPKTEAELEFPEYYQTFTDKLGFQENLSILDLICNKGPESLTYLRNIQSK